MKVKHLLALAALFLMVSCNPYRKITFTNSQFYKKERVSSNIDRYDVIVHKDSTVYEVAPTSLENGTLKGTLKSSGTPESAYTENSVDARNDIHLYLEDGADIPIDVENAESGIQINEADVEKAEMYAKDDDGLAGIFMTILVIIALVILVVIILLVVAINNSANGSNIDSGGSNSGGSDSGGSGSSSSGCFIATMAYGSYDSEPVMVLRRFRDRFLARFGWGKQFIAWYYAKSPHFVKKHETKKWLGTSLRLFLGLFVLVLRPFFRK